MNMFNTGINLYESFLFSYFFFSVSDRSNLRKGIACGIYWMLTFSLMQYVEKFSLSSTRFDVILLEWLYKAVMCTYFFHV